MQTEKDVRGLVAALKHRDPQTRKRAAAALRVVGDEAAAKPLKAALDVEVNTEARMAIAAALEHLMSDKPKSPAPQQQPQSRVERLVQHLTGLHPDLAIQAARALEEMKDRTAVPALVVVFRNRRQPAAVRLAAAEALLAMNSAPAEATLLAALRNEKWYLRRNGAAILGRLEAEWAVEPLARALYDPNELVARTAQAALRRIGTPEAQEALDRAKHAMIDTAEVTDPRISSKAKRVATGQLRQSVTGNLDAKTQEALSQQRKKGTSDLKPPPPKPKTGQLKQPLRTQQLNTVTSDSKPPAQTQPKPPQKPVRPAAQQASPPTEKPAAQTQPKPQPPKRVKSQRRKSATRRLPPLPDDLAARFTDDDDDNT